MINPIPLACMHDCAFVCYFVSILLYVPLHDCSKPFDETQVQERFEVLKKRKDVGSFTEQGKALDKRSPHQDPPLGVANSPIPVGITPTLMENIHFDRVWVRVLPFYPNCLSGDGDGCQIIPVPTTITFFFLIIFLSQHIYT